MGEREGRPGEGRGGERRGGEGRGGEGRAVPLSETFRRLWVNVSDFKRQTKK